MISKKFLWGSIIVPIIVALITALLTTIPSCNKADEANRIVREISNITNRPYILINDISADYSSREIDDGKLLIICNFTFLNNGNLPAWIIGYDIYINGSNRIIKALFGSQDKPTENFTIGKDKEESRRAIFTLMQKANEKNGDVTEFEPVRHKMLLMVVKYKTMGDANDKNIFTTWQLVRFGRFKNIKCGTNDLTANDMEIIFKEQEKIFEFNEAK